MQSWLSRHRATCSLGPLYTSHRHTHTHAAHAHRELAVVAALPLRSSVVARAHELRRRGKVLYEVIAGASYTASCRSCTCALPHNLARRQAVRQMAWHVPLPTRLHNSPVTHMADQRKVHPKQAVDHVSMGRRATCRLRPVAIRFMLKRMYATRGGSGASRCAS